MRGRRSDSPSSRLIGLPAAAFSSGPTIALAAGLAVLAALLLAGFPGAGRVEAHAATTRPAAGVITPPALPTKIGVFAYVPGWSQQAAFYTTAATTLKNSGAPISAISWRFRWEDIETADGVFTWTQIDNAIAASHGIGVLAMIRVMSGVYTPSWVYSSAPACPSISFPGSAMQNAASWPSGVTMPLPWDTCYLAKWTTFINAYAARYNTNPYVYSVQMPGAGAIGESWLPYDSNNPTQWQAAGYTDARMITAWETIITAYRTAFSHVRTNLDIGEPLAGANVMSPLTSWVLTTYPGQVDIQQNGLSASGLGKSFPIRTIIKQASATSNSGGYQMTNSVTAQPQVGPIASAFTVAIQDGVSYVEVYQDDVTNPAFLNALYYLATAGTYQAISPSRIVDSRTGLGTQQGPLTAASVRTIQVTGAPTSAGPVPSTGISAVVVNVTATDTTSASYFTVYPAGLPVPSASSLNWTGSGQTVANLVEVPLGKGGAISVAFGSSFGSASLVMDIAGWVGITTDGAGRAGIYTALPPARLLDTRSGTGTGGVIAPIAPAHSINVQVTGRGSVPATGVAAVVVNLTETNARASSFLTLYPTGQAVPAGTSNLNFAAGTTLANRAVVKVGSGGQVSIYNGNATGSVDAILDVEGWYSDGSTAVAGAGFVGLQPARFFDSRTSGTGPLASGSSFRLIFPTTATGPVSALVLNVTVTNTRAAGYLTLYPYSSAVPAPPPPTASDVNFTAGQTVANMAVVTVDAATASFLVYNGGLGATDVIVDVVGYYM